MEWLEPVYASGHWVPDIRLLVASTNLAVSAVNPFAYPREQIREWEPEVLVIMPCGLISATMQQIWDVFGGRNPISFNPAVRDGRVYAVDASSYFARPGRVVEGGTRSADSSRAVHGFSCSAESTTAKNRWYP